MNMGGIRMDLPDSPLAVAGAWATFASGVVALIYHAWRGKSKTGADVKTDETRGGWMVSLLKDRDDALRRERELMALYIKANEAIATLTVERAMLVERLERMEKEMDRVRRILITARPDLKEMLTTDFGGLIDHAEG